jgi:hypothetical protein
MLIQESVVSLLGYLRELARKVSPETGLDIGPGLDLADSRL